MLQLMYMIEDKLSFLTTWEAFLLGAAVVGVAILGLYLVSYLIDKFKRK